MSGPDPRPEAVEAAVAWLRERGDTFTPEALERGLRYGGYTEGEIEAAFKQLASPGGAEPTPVGNDLRARAAVILVVGFLATWGLMSLLLARPNTYGGMDYGPIAAVILAIVLGLFGLISLIAIAVNTRLRRGAEGALVAVLTIPFILLFIIAGLCVVTTNGLNV